MKHYPNTDSEHCKSVT